MKKEEFQQWLAGCVESQVKITIAACAGMVALGLLLFLIKGGLLYLIFSMAYGSDSVGGFIVLLIFGGLGVFTCWLAPRQLSDTEHEIESGVSLLSFRLAPPLAHAWTFAMGSIDSDQSMPQKILNMAFVVPRLFWTAWYVFGRIEKVKRVDVPNCSKVLRLVLKRSERVQASEIAEHFQDMPTPQVMYDLSLIDGVVFLTKESVGISLANRFKDKLEAAQQKSGAAPAEKNSPFDG